MVAPKLQRIYYVCLFRRLIEEAHDCIVQIIAEDPNAAQTLCFGNTLSTLNRLKAMGLKAEEMKQDYAASLFKDRGLD